MTTAFVKIHSFINSLKDDEVIRATDQKLSDAEMKKNKNAKFDNNKGATHLYVRSGFFSKLMQVFTSGTDGAIQKQHLAKELIIKTLKNLPNDLKNNDSVKQSIKNITDTLKNNELKDFTAGMIRKDLDVINNAFKFQNVIANPLYESKPVNPLYRGNSKEPDPAKRGTSDAVTAATPKVDKNVPTDGTKEPFVLKLKNKEISGGNVTEPVFNEFFDYFNFDSNDDRAKKAVLALTKDVLNNGNEEIVDSSVPAVDVNQVVNTSSKVVDKDASVANIPAWKNGVLPLEDDEISDGDDALSEVGSGSDSDDEDGAVSSSESELPSNETSSDTAVDGSPVEEPSSKPAESAPIINTIPTPIGEAIEQGADTAEAATENTPSPAPSASSSTAETKNSAKANPHLASLQSKWRPIGNGYQQITELFSITAGISTSSMIADAYLLPSDMRLTFQGRKTETEIKSGIGNLVKGQHTFPKNPFNTRPNINSRESNYDTDRPYTQISVARPPKILSFDKLTKDQEEEFKEKLDSIYKSSIDDIVKEHKNDNNGEDPESLVVVPIFQDVAKVSSVEINSLVDAIITAQASNPKLKINISAGSDNHKKLIQEAFEKKMSESI